MFRLFSLLAMLCPFLLLSQTKTSFPVTGKVVTPLGSPLPGADLTLLASKRRAVSGADGSFRLDINSFPDTIVVSLTGYRLRKIPLPASTVFLEVQLEALVADLGEVVVSTGYQSLPKERATGSFVQIDNSLLNRKPGANILDRLDGIASGLLFNRNRTPGSNESAIMIRGRSTLFASPEPLIVVDNFPFDGDINNINPNDVETITLLRDAAAASIWGVRSGNGVIVITTKKGKAGQAPRLSFNTHIIIGEKPNLYYQPVLNAAGYIAVESFLFSKGYYNSRLTSPYLGFAPAVDIFTQRKAGLINAADSTLQIDALASNDVRADLLNYFYRSSVSRQYSLSLSGASSSGQYYLSAGYDKNLANIINNSQDRITVHGRNSYLLIKDRLEFSGDFSFSSSNTQVSASAVNAGYPVYTKLVDDNGNALPVYRDYRKKWLDTIGQGQLLDWTQRPYDEQRLADNKTLLTDFRLLTSIAYTIRKGWQFSLSYQFEKGISDSRNLQGQQSYTTRDMVNRFTQPDYATRIPARAVPVGDVLDLNSLSFTSHYARAQMNYNKVFKKNHRLDILAGAEIKDYNSFNWARRLFGYSDDNATDITINSVSQFVTLPAGSLARISSINSQKGATDRYLSYFGNAGLTIHERYLFNVSARRDESNLFGVSANQKAVPLWSAGAGWIISRETFFKSAFISYLKLRLTYGYNGNVDKSTSAFTTAGVGISSIFQQPGAFLVNPPNPELSWEKISMVNSGIDFSLFRGAVNGSFDYYYKRGRDLIGNSEVASQTGVSQFRQNIAELTTRGFDISLSAKLLNGPFSWKFFLLHSHAADRVSRYLLRPGQVKAFVTAITSNPFEGKPWSAIFAYPWAGLSAATGDPRGLVNGQPSADYTRIINPVLKDELLYMGPGRPTDFGSIRNEISLRRFSLSVNVTYELGYWYRRSSVNYNTLFGASMTYGILASGDVVNRWQKPGDELLTNVPSMVYPAVSAREEFYQYSQTLVERGDHLRLRDIRVGYDFEMNTHRSVLKSCRIYFYANNIAILWRANKSGIDPNSVTGLPAPRTVALGASLEF
jgi:TonB-linked SusC/RagA family outer membrane protein